MPNIAGLVPGSHIWTVFLLTVCHESLKISPDLAAAFKNLDRKEISHRFPHAHVSYQSFVLSMGDATSRPDHSGDGDTPTRITVLKFILYMVDVIFLDLSPKRKGEGILTVTGDLHVNDKDVIGRDHHQVRLQIPSRGNTEYWFFQDYVF